MFPSNVLLPSHCPRKLSTRREGSLSERPSSPSARPSQRARPGGLLHAAPVQQRPPALPQPGAAPGGLGGRRTRTPGFFRKPGSLPPPVGEERTGRRKNGEGQEGDEGRVQGARRGPPGACGACRGSKTAASRTVSARVSARAGRGSRRPPAAPGPAAGGAASGTPLPARPRRATASGGRFFSSSWPRNQPLPLPARGAGDDAPAPGPSVKRFFFCWPRIPLPTPRGAGDDAPAPALL